MAVKREIEGDIVMGWPDRKRATPHVLKDSDGRVLSVQTPVAELVGLITPTDLRYVKVQLDAPDPVHPDDWSLSIVGEVGQTIEFGFDDLRKLPATTVRCVSECSGSDSDLFDYLKSGGETYGCYQHLPQQGKPLRFDPEMDHNGWMSSGEWTGVPLALLLEMAGVKPSAVGVLAQGFDTGRPGETATIGAQKIPEGEISFEKCLPLEKALHPDTLVAWALNGEFIRHIHGGPIRLIVPGWSGNWSVKWIQRLEVMDHMPSLYYPTEYFYYARSPEGTDKEMITAMGVKSIITDPMDDDPPLAQGTQCHWLGLER